MAEESLTFADITRPRHHPAAQTVYEADGLIELRLDVPARDPAVLVDQLSDSIQRELGRRPVASSIYVLNSEKKSRGRDWHQDDHPSVNDYLPPKWVTLVVAYADCPAGTLEYVPGSHRWPVAERETLLSHLEAEYHGYGWRECTAEFVVPAFTAELQAQRQGRTQRPPLRAGAVLVFHPWLWHRSDPGVERDAQVLQVGLT